MLSKRIVAQLKQVFEQQGHFKHFLQELTSHLQNLTQSLYAKQREVDRSQLKQLESQVDRF